MKKVAVLAICIALVALACASLGQTQFLTLNGVELYRDTPAPIATYHDSLLVPPVSIYTLAIQRINDEVGCEVFAYPAEVAPLIGDDAIPPAYPEGVRLECWNRSIELRGGDPDVKVGLCINGFVRDTGRIVDSTTWIPCLVEDVRTNTRLAVHELLHTLGFAHDREMHSVMYKNIVYAGDKIQPDDIAEIRERYCR